jgi:hypothetical protein
VLLGTITVDRTGLTGRYTLDLDYLFTGAAPPPDFAGPSLPTAIKDVGIAAGAGQGTPQAAGHRQRTAARGELGDCVVAYGLDLL